MIYSHHHETLSRNEFPDLEDNRTTDHLTTTTVSVDCTTETWQGMLMPTISMLQLLIDQTQYGHEEQKEKGRWK